MMTGLPGVVEQRARRAHQVRADEVAGVGRAADRDAEVFEHDLAVVLDLELALGRQRHVLPLAGDCLEGVAERDGHERGRHELFVRDLEVPVGDAARPARLDLHGHRDRSAPARSATRRSTACRSLTSAPDGSRTGMPILKRAHARWPRTRARLPIAVGRAVTPPFIIGWPKATQLVALDARHRAEPHRAHVAADQLHADGAAVFEACGRVGSGLRAAAAGLHRLEPERREEVARAASIEPAVMPPSSSGVATGASVVPLVTA